MHACRGQEFWRRRGRTLALLWSRRTRRVLYRLGPPRTALCSKVAVEVGVIHDLQDGVVVHGNAKGTSLSARRPEQPAVERHELLEALHLNVIDTKELAEFGALELRLDSRVEVSPNCDLDHTPECSKSPVRGWNERQSERPKNDGLVVLSGWGVCHGAGRQLSPTQCGGHLARGRQKVHARAVQRMLSRQLHGYWPLSLRFEAMPDGPQDVGICREPLLYSGRCVGERHYRIVAAAEDDALCVGSGRRDFVEEDHFCRVALEASARLMWSATSSAPTPIERAAPRVEEGQTRMIQLHSALFSRRDLCRWPEGVAVTSPRTAARRQLAINACTELVGLTDAHLEAPLAGSIADPEWSWLGPALIARMNESAIAITRLLAVGMETEAGSLARSFYEHAVDFAWIAADPDERVTQWLRVDAEKQLKSHRKFLDLGEPDYLPEPIRARYERLAADTALGSGFPRDAAGRAERADEEWGLTGMQSFKSLYTVVFRQFSAVLHPSLLGLSQHAYPVSDAAFTGPALRVGHTNIDDEATAITMQMPILLATAWYVARLALGWPDIRESRRVVENYIEKVNALEHAAP